MSCHCNSLYFFTLIYGGGYKFWNSSAGFIPRLLSLAWVKIFISQLCSKTPLIYFSPSWSKTKSHRHIKEQAAFYSGSAETASYTGRGRWKISSWIAESISPSPPFFNERYIMPIPKNLPTAIYPYINMKMRTTIRYYSARCTENVQRSDPFEVIIFTACCQV
jgi:hypothetical protein